VEAAPALAGEGRLRSRKISTSTAIPIFGSRQRTSSLDPVADVRNIKVERQRHRLHFFHPTDADGRFRAMGSVPLDPENVESTCEKTGYRTA